MVTESNKEVHYSPVQRKYIKLVLRDFHGLFEWKTAPTKYEVRTHFHEPLRSVQVKWKEVSIHVLPKDEATIENLLKEGHIENLGKCTEDFFAVTTVVTTKRNGTLKFPMNSKIISKQTYRNSFQMPNMNELVDKVTLAMCGHTSDSIWFSNPDLNYSQMPLIEKTRRQCSLWTRAFPDWMLCQMIYNGLWIQW